MLTRGLMWIRVLYVALLPALAGMGLAFEYSGHDIRRSVFLGIFGVVVYLGVNLELFAFPRSFLAGLAVLVATPLQITLACYIAGDSIWTFLVDDFFIECMALCTGLSITAFFWGPGKGASLTLFFGAIATGIAFAYGLPALRYLPEAQPAWIVLHVTAFGTALWGEVWLLRGLATGEKSSASVRRGMGRSLAAMLPGKRRRAVLVPPKGAMVVLIVIGIFSWMLGTCGGRAVREAGWVGGESVLADADAGPGGAPAAEVISRTARADAVPEPPEMSTHRVGDVHVDLPVAWSVKRRGITLVATSPDGRMEIGLVPKLGNDLRVLYDGAMREVRKMGTNVRTRPPVSIRLHSGLEGLRGEVRLQYRGQDREMGILVLRTGERRALTFMGSGPRNSPFTPTLVAIIRSIRPAARE